MQQSAKIMRQYQIEMDALEFQKNRNPRLKASTKLACNLFDMIRKSVVYMVRLQTVLTKKEFELIQLKTKLDLLKEKTTPVRTS